MLCQTEKGLLILQEFHGSEKKLKMQQQLQKQLIESGFCVGCYLENQEGSLVTSDRDHVPYTLAYWIEGRECDPRSQEDLKSSVRYLGALHRAMELPFSGDYLQRSLRDTYLGHNRELRKIRRFIYEKGVSGRFEEIFLSGVEQHLKKGEEALSALEASAYEQLREESITRGAVCHGEYHQHNVYITKDGMTAVNFGHWNFDIQIADLYRFLRKIMEKYNWDPVLARRLLKIYHEENPISRELWENLRIRFCYPEKFWKLSDYYYTHKKSWISEKNVEKLKTVVRQMPIWEEFTETTFSQYPF
jgi:CotS family spore coat protein